MAGDKSLMVEDEREMEEEKENLVVHRTESPERGKETAVEQGDAPMKSSRPVLMFALGLMPRYLVHMLLAALRDARRVANNSTIQADITEIKSTQNILITLH